MNNVWSQDRQTTGTDDAAHSPAHAASVGKMIRVAIVNDYDLIVAGVASMLEQDRRRIQVKELDPLEANVDSVDVVSLRHGRSAGQLDGAAREDPQEAGCRPVVVYTWEVRSDLAREAIVRGAAGYLSKALTGPRVADAI